MAKTFSAKFVLAVTMKYMVRSVDISINKTFNRIHEFDSNSAESNEVFKALSGLHSLKRQLQLIQQSLEK
jgi:hypothetical protein